MKLKIKKGDTVKLLAGDERGKTGEVIQLFKSDSRAIVKGLNIVKKHQKATKENKGGIISIEKSIHLSNLSIVDNDKKKINEGKKEIKKKETKKTNNKTKIKSEKKVKKNSSKKDVKKTKKPTKKVKK